MMDTFPLEDKVEKATKSLKENTFLEKSLSIVILGGIGILGSVFKSFSSLSSKENKAKDPGEAFLETEETKTLLEKYFVMQ